MTNSVEDNQPAREPQAEGSTSTPPVAPVQTEVSNHPDQVARQDSDTAKELAREFRWMEFAQLIINGGLAIIGIVALCIYHSQLVVMQGQLGEIIRQYPEIKKSADAAKDAASISGAALHADQRAWIIPTNDDGTQTAFPHVGDRLQEPFHFANSGKTPARNVRGVIYLKLLDNHESPEFDEPVKEGAGKTIGQGFWMGLLPPNLPKNLVIKGAEAKEPTLSGYPRESYIALYGRITYSDIFGHQHWVHFCSARPIPESDTSRDARARCINYNDVDRDIE